jgi:hypothetical protein
MAVPPAPLPTPGQRVPDVVVITFGKGGRMDEHHQKYTDYRLAKTKVEIRGPCYSACTLVLGYVPAENLCIAEGAFMAFHAVRSKESGERMNYVLGTPTTACRKSDFGSMTTAGIACHRGYWTLYDRQLWAMGHAKCKQVNWRPMKFLAPPAFLGVGAAMRRTALALGCAVLATAIIDPGVTTPAASAEITPGHRCGRMSSPYAEYRC